MLIEMIWAQSSNGVIGIDNKLPWHIKEDLEYFKNKTLNKSIIMGRKTFESIGQKPLPKRENIVITSKNINIENVQTAKTINEGVQIASSTSIIIGGEKIYKEGMKYANILYVTKIQNEYDGNKYAPEITGDFELVKSDKVKTKENIYLTFEKYKRKTL